MASHRRRLRGMPAFTTSAVYWEDRYRLGGDSGDGSLGAMARWKAEVVNAFVQEHALTSLIDFGCGDGQQAALLTCPSYVGVDISPTALRLAQRRCAHRPGWRWLLPEDAAAARAPLALSLDVVYHLVEDAAFTDYMIQLFAASTQYVMLYTSNTVAYPCVPAPHIVPRCVTAWIATHLPQWRLIRHIPSRYPYNPVTERGSLSEFFIYAVVA